MADSYVCSGAMMKCTMGSSPAKLTVLPSRTVFLAGQPQANISDHKSMVNLAPFGVCRSLAFPPTASATAAAMGTLTPMPCIHNTPAPWFVGKMDTLIKGQPALLQSCKCQCMWGGTISLINNGQVAIGAQGVNETPFGQIELDASSPLLATIAQESSQGFSPLNEALKHLIELKKINPKEALKDIPTSWKKEYIAAIKNINNNGIDGFASSYSDVEHAYNIYKLATSDAAKQYGLDKLSDKTPYQVFDIEKEIPGFINNMPSKEFWDTFDTYVPLYTHIGTGAYFSPDYGYVVIPMTENSKKRMADSDWYQAGRFHHEYGHAYDHMNGWRNDPEFTQLYADFKKEMQDSDITKNLKEFIANKGGTSKLSANELEKLMSLSDSLQAATSGHESIPPGGHSKDYFASEDKQMAEFIAHMSENYWSGNDLYESLAPETYKKMIELLEKRW